MVKRHSDSTKGFVQFRRNFSFPHLYSELPWEKCVIKTVWGATSFHDSKLLEGYSLTQSTIRSILVQNICSINVWLNLLVYNFLKNTSQVLQNILVIQKKKMSHYRMCFKDPLGHFICNSFFIPLGPFFCQEDDAKEKNICFDFWPYPK